MNNAEKFINLMNLYTHKPTINAIDKTTEAFINSINFYGVDKTNGNFIYIFTDFCGLIIYSPNQNRQVDYSIANDIKTFNNENTISFLKIISNIVGTDDFITMKNNFFGKTTEEIING